MALNKEHTGVTIRNPATANLMIDSTDRPTTSSSADFTIAKTNSILNGFFTRAAVNEVVLQWGLSNISSDFGNNTLTLTLTGAATYTITLPSGNYTVEGAIKAIVALLNIAQVVVVFTEQPFGNVYGLTNNLQTTFSIAPGNLQAQMGLTPTTLLAENLIFNPFLLPYRYIDFISNDLTYNQRLKDASTAPLVRDVLYRWVFAWDAPTPLDAYGYAIYQGYVPFVARRALPFPKQIRWEVNMPIGNLSFQVYNDRGQLLTPSQAASNQLEYNMGLLVSED